MRFNLIAFAGFVLTVSACSYTESKPDRAEDHIIGTRLSAVSSLTSDMGEDESKVAIYDPVINKIHQFDLGKMVHERTLSPVIPSGKHYVLYDQTGNYVIDLSQKHLSIFNRAGQLNDQPIRFVGTPISGAFRPSQGLLVIYDDRQSVGMLQINANGDVARSWVGGPIITGNFSISAGDIDDQGHLILALSDDSLAVVDLVQSMTQHQWVLVKPAFASGLTGISWVAPVHDQPNQMLMLTPTQIVLFDTNTQSVVTTAPIDSAHKVMKTSKVFDPHIMLSKGEETDFIYAKASALRAIPSYYQVNRLLTSRLSLAHDSWTIIDSTTQSTRLANWNGVGWVYVDDPNVEKTGRQLRRYRVSDMLATAQVALPDGVQLEMTENHVLELYPSALGKAVNYSVTDSTSAMITLFNKPYIH